MNDDLPPPLAPLLLATEHTDQDAGAEALALALARRRGMPLAAVLALPRDAELEMTAPAAAERADAEAARRREALGAAAAAAGVVLALRLRRGPQPHDEIVDEARVRGSALVVIRRRGRRGLLAQLLVGERVGKVLAQSPCSVLVVPREAKLWQRSVLVAVHPHGDGAPLVAAAAALARECGAALHVVCVAARESERAAAAQALAQALAATPEGVASRQGEVHVGPAAAGIAAAAAATGAELLVVGRSATPARPGLGGVAREVTGAAGCPVLVVVPQGPHGPHGPQGPQGLHGPHAQQEAAS